MSRPQGAATGLTEADGSNVFGKETHLPVIDSSISWPLSDTLLKVSDNELLTCLFLVSVFPCLSPVLGQSLCWALSPGSPFPSSGPSKL